VSKVRTDPIFPFIFPFPFSLRAPASINDACIYTYDELRLGVLSKNELSLILRDETVFGVTNSRYHATLSSERVFFRRRCNDLTFHLSRRSRARRRNESRQRMLNVETRPYFPFPYFPFRFALEFAAAAGGWSRRESSDIDGQTDRSK
jgi:hypothetical protein